MRKLLGGHTTFKKWHNISTKAVYTKLGQHLPLRHLSRQQHSTSGHAIFKKQCDFMSPRAVYSKFGQ